MQQQLKRVRENEAGRGKAELAPPVQARKVVHRNPNHVAKDVALACGTVNPLLSRLYTDGVSSGAALRIPNHLAQPPRVGHQQPPHLALASETEGERAEAAATRAEKGTSHNGRQAGNSERGVTVFVNSLQVFRQPHYRDEDLRQIFARSAQQKVIPTARKKPHSPKLEPLPTSGVIGTRSVALQQQGSNAPANDTTAITAATTMTTTTRNTAAIPRFHKATSNAPNEFTYLMVRPRGVRDRFNPYDLQVVQHKDLHGKHYYTVSAAGVTQFTNGAAEFIELDTWERECKIFQQISELPVFRDYKLWRSFLIWRGLVRRQAMNSSRAFLTKNLFQVHPNLSGALQLVRRMCLDFYANNNLYLPATDTHSLQNYMTQLHNHLHGQRTKLEKMMRQIREQVEAACKSAMLAAQLERERMNVLREDAERRRRKVVDSVRELGGQQQQPSYIEMTQRKATCRRLTAFIRLCDYIVITCITRLASKAIATLREDVEYDKAHAATLAQSSRPLTPLKAGERKVAGGTPAPTAGGAAASATTAGNKSADAAATTPFTGPLLSVDVVYSEREQQITVLPSQQQVVDTIEDVIRDYVETADGVPRLVAMDAFKVYTANNDDGMSDEAGSGGGGGGPDVAEMVTAEEDYTRNLTAIRASLARAFVDVESYAHSFDTYRDMYIANAQLDEEAIVQRTETIDFFRDHLNLYKNQTEAITSRIPNAKDVGLIRVHTEGLRDFFAPSPLGCLAAFHRIMPRIAHKQNELILVELQRHNTYLAAMPKTVEHYVEYLAYYKHLESAFDSVATAYDFIRELFSLLQEEKVDIDEDDEETYRNGTRPQFDKLRTLMQVIDDGKEAQQRLFTRNIDEQMEQLRHRIEAVYDKAGQPIVMSGEADVTEVIEYITELQREAEGLAAREKELRRYQLAIGAEETTVDTMGDMLNDVNIKTKLWVGIRDWDAFTTETCNTPFEQLDVSAIQDTVQRYTALLKHVSTKLASNGAVPKLRAKVEEWRALMPILLTLTNPKMKAEHLSRVSAVVGHIEDANTGVSKTLAEWGNQFTIAMLLANDVLRFRDEIQAIGIAATEEDKLQQQIDRVNAMWNGGGPKPAMEFHFHNHKDIKDTYTLVGSSVEDVAALLDDSTIAISTIGSSKYCHGILRAQVDRWENRLRYMQETLDRWVELQRSWIYLENIFSSSEIRSQWKDDAKRFEKVDRFFRDLMRKAHDLPTAYRGLLINPPSFEPGEMEEEGGKTLRTDLVNYIKELEKVLASLEKKLEEKRRAFPRFYFLSNDDLLDILAKVKTPELMMPHMLKMFDGIKSLAMGGGDGNDITHLVSMEGEVVELVNKTIKARGPVEVWMDLLEREMFTSLRRHAQSCLEDYEERQDRHTWMFQHPVQLVLIMEQLLWTRAVEEALDTDDAEQRMQRLREANYATLEAMAALTGRKLSKVQRILLSTMITIDVHGRDLVDEMCEQRVLTSREFGWSKQLRVYWERAEDGHGNIFIRQNNSCFVYGYEYLGAQGRLVITPLTDRIYMTVTGALKLYLGAAPAGPAGTGKTETVKDLAKNLARQCIVYNCSDGVTYKMMEKFFSGLIQNGAWACLDEFNRINIEVLSVIASQLLEIKLALQNGKESFTFQGTPNVRVRTTYGAFITMNPGYAGRTELPDNLKILFRPVAVMTPDFRMIAEVILYSEGFTNAKDLSLKITQLYKLSSEQLSSQDHYDFGMRALKSILVMAGDLKRSQPAVDEDLTLIVACNDSNVPKFVAEDLPLFRGIMQDLFPGVTFPEREYAELLPAMHRAMAAKKLVDMGAWVKKGIQFYETLIVRHGVMLVGATGCGKTEARCCIAEALTSMHASGSSSNAMARPVHQFVLNPKALLLHELYGQLDVNTNEWRDGVLAAIAKACVRDSEGCTDHRWIVFDGPVDTLWIESLNSVLDDSKLLCLDSGERIKLPDTIHMLFEVGDLAVASPATVSRCGMVYVDASDLPWRAVVGRWAESELSLAGASPLCRRYIIALFEQYVDDGLRWLRQQRTLVSAGEINTVQSMCNLFSAMMRANEVSLAGGSEAAERALSTRRRSSSIVQAAAVAAAAAGGGAGVNAMAAGEFDDPLFRERNELCNILFLFSYVWSIGGNVEQAAMESFDTFVRTRLEGVVPLPRHGSVYDYTINFTTRLFVPWETKMANFEYDPAMPFFNILVPTVDTVRYSTLAKTLLQSGKPLLFSGQSGVGKSVIMADCLQQNKEVLQLSIVTFQFSAQTSSGRTQELIEAKLKQKRKNILGAPPGRTVVLFIDDLNMPALEVFGASPPIELLRQLMGNGGFYDRKVAGFWKYVQDVVVVAACGPPEGGRNPLTPRLTRLFHLLQIPNLTDDSMRRIFGAILHGFLESKNFNKEVKDMAGVVVSVSVDIFHKLRSGLRPRPTTPHYTFNLRDVAKVFQGITQVLPRLCRDRRAMTRLWMHECMRCFYDRLATADDRRFFTEELMMEALGRLSPGGGGGGHTHEELFEGDPVVWGDFLRFGATERVYEEATEFSRLPHLFDEYQDDYNATLAMAKPDEQATQQPAAAPLNLVFFGDHCAHLARLIRILRQPRGNALLVGVGGSGKRSLARLASYIAECRVFQITVGKGYSMNEFHEFLLELYTYAGVTNKACVFLLSDNQLVHDAMLEDVNNMLNSGEVPSLFTAEEREKRINACIEAAQQLGISNRDDIYNFFISRVRDNMHLVLGMSPVGDAFRTRCRQFPSLTNCCAIDWFDEWPTEALAGVAARQLQEMDGTMPAEMLHRLPELCVEVHSAITQLAQAYWDELRRRYYITPTSYLEFIELYKRVYGERRATLAEQLARVQNGKEKMRETDETIAKMKKEIEVKRPQLEKASQETEAVVADLKVRQARASEVQVQVRAQQESAAAQQIEASSMAAEASSRLAEAKPIIDRAKAALDTIQASDLNELRSFANPPSAVLKTTQACMVMFDPKEFNGAWSGSVDWKGAREFLSYRPLLDMIRGYPTDNVKPAILQKIQKYVNDDEFTVEICSMRGSQTCGSLCAWVHAVHEYSKVVKEVAPMRQAAAEAEAHLAETNAKLRAAQQQLQEVEKELAELEKNYEASLKKKNDLETGLRICITRLENAETLSGSLKSEGVRWTESIAQLAQRLDALPLQCFMASACAAYFGAFTPLFRRRVMQEWATRLATHGLDVGNCSLLQIMGDPVDTLNWQVNSLPTDDTSTENAIIAMLSHAPSRWPLCIDPQEQALKWLTQQYGQQMLGTGAKARSALKIIKLTETTWMRTLEAQIRLGGVVVIDDVGETLDPALEPLLARRLTSPDGGLTQQIQLTVQSGPIDYHPNFRLFLCTKLPNPHFLPDISTRVALLNFTVTREGLEEQMLGEVVAIAKRAIEEEKNSIIQSIAQGQKKLRVLEETILERLKSTRGNILDDRDLITELKSAQSNAEVLGENERQARQKMEVISAAREKYRPVAVRASVLFFVLADVARVDPMYQYSLQYFVKVVRAEVEAATRPADYNEEDAGMLHDYLTTILDGLTATTYKLVCRGLFNKDKMLLSLLITTAIGRHRGDIAEEEWQYLVRASALVAAELPETPGALGWLSRHQWELAEALARTVPALHKLLDNLVRFPEEWRSFVQAEAPQATPLPCDLDAQLTPFQRVLLIRCFRIEKLCLALADYVIKVMGPSFLEPPPFDLVRALKDSAPGTPIIFILSQGADPMDALQAFAATEGRELQYVSLGQGQGENAKRLIASCRTSGAWALLQNCHLAKSFMPELEVQVAALQQAAPSSSTSSLQQTAQQQQQSQLITSHLTGPNMTQGHPGGVAAGGNNNNNNNNNALAIHPDFRLWLTSMPTSFFPIFVLQTSIKITNEPPTGLRANMVRCFNDLTEDEYEAFARPVSADIAAAADDGKDAAMVSRASKQHAFSKLLYGLCFFHSIVLERKKFGPLGWNVRYEWNDTDFHVSKQWLRLFFEEQSSIPWESLEYIVGQIIYGGRVTDPQDRGTLQTILRRYLCPAILDDGYTFSESGRYRAPSEDTLVAARRHIAGMSAEDEPEVFGMHENASLRYQLQNSQYLLDTIVSIQPRAVGGGGGGGGGGGSSTEEEVRRKCRELETSLPQPLCREDAHPSSFTTLANGLPNSMSTVLAHEMVKYNTLLARMRQSLADMQKALQGLTVLSSDLDAMYSSVLADQVPALWASVAYTSLKPLGSWFRDFVDRMRFIHTWIVKGEPKAFWIGGFYNPSAFMTGVYQAFARAEGVSVDKLGFSYKVIHKEVEDVTVAPERGCYVYGIYTDAWRWDATREVMADSLPGEPYAMLPVVHFLPESYHRRPATHHAVPLYRTTIRAGVISSLGASSNYVLSVEMPSAQGSDYWLLKGAACICALNE